MLQRFISEYPQVKKEALKNNPFASLITNEIPNVLAKEINNSQYLVKGSVGQGNWADIPWVAILDTKITTSTQKGVFIVYLLAKNTGSLYLTLNQGCTDILNKKNSRRGTIAIMRNEAVSIIAQLDSRNFCSDEKIFLGTGLTERGELYQQGTIFYKEYKKNLLPSDDELVDDLHRMLGIYQDYATKFTENNLDSETNGNTIMKQSNLNNEIYYGVPGTGKTFTIQNEYINNAQRKANTFSVTFHQAFSYEEFVEGLKAELSSDKTQVSYMVKPGIFYEACEKAANLAGASSLQDLINDPERQAKMNKAISEEKVVYFCIDEINRGNVAAIFGDLISLIENSKRIGKENEMLVTLPYSKKIFGVPANLKIIGTMNTADRSIQLLDSALRRRFSFVECKPDYSKITNETAKSILKNINAKIRAYLGKDYQIGHTYLMDAKTDLDIFIVLRDKIIPLLEEYFYGETDKIRNILNEKDEDENNFYSKDQDAFTAYQNMTGDYEERSNFYSLSDELNSVINETDASKYLSHLKDSLHA